MKKVHVKMNKVLAAVLSVLLVCSSVSMGHVFADTASSGESSGEVSDGVDITEPAGGADTDVPTDGTDANISADVGATAEPTESPADVTATVEPTEPPADVMATAEPTEPPADVTATAEPTESPEPADVTATAEPTEPPADVPATAEPTEPPAPADVPATAEPTETPAPGDVPATAEPTETPAPGDVPATAEPTESPTPADAPAVGTLTASPVSADGAGISTYAADGAYLFRYAGEADKAAKLKPALTPVTVWGNTKALALTSSETKIPIGETEETGKTINAGTVVFDIELCPASSATESVVLKNSKDQTLFVIRVDSSNDKVYLSDAVSSTTSIVSLGTYSAGGIDKTNFWFRLRIELYFEDSQNGVLNFRVSTMTCPAKNTYNTSISEWIAIKSITQEDLPEAYKNGTVTSGIDGSEAAPFDLHSISIHTTKTGRWIGGISLYAITGDITLVTPPGAQTVGTDFKIGDAAVEVTYSNGEKETLKLADMLYGVDYTIEGYSTETAAADSVPITIYYGGKELKTTVEVKALEKKMTGIEVKTKPGKTTYKVGDSFDKTGLVVQAVYSDTIKEYREELSEEDYEITIPDMNTVGRQEVVVTYKKDSSFTCEFPINVNAAELPKQSFYYIDADDISNLNLEAAEGGDLDVTASEKGSNETNKLQVKGTVKKVLDQAINSGTVTFETVGYQNGAIFGIKILDSQSNALINYAQQTSGNLNMYKGTEITGTGNTVNLASKRTSKWVRVVTEIDLDASNEKGVLQFEMSTYYKNAYTDDEWTLEKTVTQKEAFLDFNVASGCATEGLTSFDIKELQFESNGTSYVDDILFNDGNGISDIVTSTKTLQSMEITKPASLLEFVQGSELNTAGLELTGTYLVEYSDGSLSETKKFKINKYETEYDFSEVKDESVVTIKVTDNGKEFTETYKVKVTAKPDGSYVTFSYTDEESAAMVGFDGSKISVTSSAAGNDSSNTSNKIKLDKGTSTLKLADTLSSGTVHLETEFLTTGTGKASLFMRILNSEGNPMVDIGQYGSSNLNLYLDKATTGDFAHRFGGLPVKQWARAEIDIDLDQSNKLNQLVFEAVVWTTDDYGSGEWTKFAEFDQNVYINGNGTVHSANGSASTKATKFDVASIELQNADGTNYYDNMFFEAINGKASKVLTDLKIVSPARKTTYYVGDRANTGGLVLNGVYEYTFSDGSKKQMESRVMKFTAALDSSEPNENALVTISAGGQTVTYPVTVLPSGKLGQIEEYLVSYVDNILVTLGEDDVVKVNKRQIRLPAKYENGETLTWEVVSGTAELEENILTVIPSEDKATETVLQVTMFATNEDGDGIEIKKEVTLAVPMDSKKVMDDSMTTEESIRNALNAMYARGLFNGQADMKDVDAIMADLERDITIEEIAVMLVNLFDIDTTYSYTRINRWDVEDNAWYSAYVRAAFQLSVETRDSREGKKSYGIGKGISEANLRYMVDRIVKIDQTTLPSDYVERMFE